MKPVTKLKYGGKRMQSEPSFFSRHLKIVSGVFGRKKIIIGMAAIFVLVVAGFYFLAGTRKASGNYLTSTVKKSTITSSIPASGVVEPVKTVSLGFENAEVIKKIYVKVGDRVTAGQLLAEQDTASLEAQVIQASANLKEATANLELLKEGSRPEEVARAEADVKMARASYDLAKSKLERYKQFFNEGYISQADLDQIISDFTTAEAKLKQAEESLKLLQAGNRPEDIAAAAARVESCRAQLQMARKDLAEAKLFSPIDGIVSEVNGSEGQRAAANNNNTSGGGFITIISEALQVRAQVNEADIGRLKVGQKAEFTVNSFPNKTFTGRVSSISPQAYTESNVQLYDAVIQLDKNQDGLMAGMPANVNIIVDRHENVLTVPKSAVTYAVSYLNKMRQGGAPGQRPSGSDSGGGHTGGAGAGGAGSARGGGNETGTSGAARANEQGQQALVLVLDNSGKPSPRRVVLGLADLTSYEVLEGLEEGDLVVIGSLDQETGSTSSRGGSMPFMPGGMPPGGGGGGRR